MKVQNPISVEKSEGSLKTLFTFSSQRFNVLNPQPIYPIKCAIKAPRVAIMEAAPKPNNKGRIPPFPNPITEGLSPTAAIAIPIAQVLN